MLHWILLFPETVVQGGSHGYIRIDRGCHWRGCLVRAVEIVYFSGGIGVSGVAQDIGVIESNRRKRKHC